MIGEELFTFLQKHYVGGRCRVSILIRPNLFIKKINMFANLKILFEYH